MNFLCRAWSASVARKLYWSAVVIMLAAAGWQRFALPVDPIADPDTWGYLGPALNTLTGGEFAHTHGRNFVYPAFVYLLLRAFGDFRAITVAQHLLALGGALLFLHTWQRARVFVSSPKINPALYDLLGLAAVAAFLFGGDPVPFELQLRPEGVCAFVISINLFAAVHFVARAFIERRGASVPCGIALVFSSVVLGSLKPSFGLVAVVAVTPVIVFVCRRGNSQTKLLLVFGSSVSAGILLVPEHLLGAHDEIKKTFLPTTLFVVHANLIRDQMREDLENNTTLPYRREWLNEVQAALNSEIEKSSAAGLRRFPVLGFDPDYLMYEPSSIAAQLSRDANGQIGSLCDFYRFYYQRIWLHRPLAVMRKVARQMGIFYAAVCPVYGRGKSSALAAMYQRSFESLQREPYQSVWSAYAAAIDFMHRTEVLSRTAAVVRQHHGQRFRSVLARSHLPMLLSAVLLAGVVALRRDYRPRFGCIAALVVFAYLLNAASCLEVAVLHSLEIRRYITIQLPFTVFAQFLALRFLIELSLAAKPHAAPSEHRSA